MIDWKVGDEAFVEGPSGMRVAKVTKILPRRVYVGDVAFAHNGRRIGDNDTWRPTTARLATEEDKQLIARKILVRATDRAIQLVQERLSRATVEELAELSAFLKLWAEKEGVCAGQTP